MNSNSSKLRLFGLVLTEIVLATSILWATNVSALEISPKPSGIRPVPTGQSDSIIGDLGGVPVVIPKPYANFVEYDRDPHFMESKSFGELPVRTFQSKVRSFGFEVRFPDMATANADTLKQKNQENIYTSTWLRVVVSSGEDYGGNPIENYVKNKTELRRPYPPYRYEKLPQSVFGLTAYAPLGFDESKRSMPGGTNFTDMNVYVHRGQDGQADAYIECSNAEHAAAPCQLRFNLAPAMLANISVNFRVGMLQHWKQIQSSITEVVLGFRANPKPSITQKGK